MKETSNNIIYHLKHSTKTTDDENNNHENNHENNDYYNNQENENDNNDENDEFFFNEDIKTTSHSNISILDDEQTKISSKNDEQSSRNESVIHNDDIYNKWTLRDIEIHLSKYYKPTSTKLELIIIYLNGQKNIYLQSQSITELKLNLLFFISIILSAITSIFAPFTTTQNLWWSGITVSCINAIILIFIALISFLKLESTAEKYFILHNEYDKIIINMEFFYNRILYTSQREQRNTLILKQMDEIENNIQTLKNYFKVLIPREVKHIFPLIYNINIFLFIKKMENRRNNLIQEYCNIKNEILYIQQQQFQQQQQPTTPPPTYKSTCNNRNIKRNNHNDYYNNSNHSNNSNHYAKLRASSNISFHQSNRIETLYAVKEQIKNDLIEYKNAYSLMENYFVREIQFAEQNSGFFSLFFFKIPKIEEEEKNKVIYDYVKMFEYN